MNLTKRFLSRAAWLTASAIVFGSTFIIATVVVERTSPQSDVVWSEIPNEQYTMDPIDLEPYGASLGIDGFRTPEPTDIMAGWNGEAAIGGQCVVGIAVDTFSTKDGSIRLAISSYDRSHLITTGWTADYDALKGIMAYYTNWCHGGEWPGYLPLEVLDPAPALSA